MGMNKREITEFNIKTAVKLHNKGMYMKDIAIEMGMSAPTISYYLKGQGLKPKLVETYENRPRPIKKRVGKFAHIK